MIWVGEIGLDTHIHIKIHTVNYIRINLFSHTAVTREHTHLYLLFIHCFNYG